MWEFYLLACEAGFRHSGLTVFQLQLTKKIDALPITRDYMFSEERRLMAGEAGVPAQDRAWPASRLQRDSLRTLCITGISSRATWCAIRCPQGESA